MSVHRRGDAWRVHVYAGTEPGSGRRRYITETHPTLREAREAEARIKIDVVDGRRTVTRAVTVGDLLDTYVATNGDHWSPSTLHNTRRWTHQYLGPLRRVDARKLTTADLNRFYAQLRAGGGRNGTPLTAATVRRQVHVPLRAALALGVETGQLTQNVAVNAKPGTVIRARRAYPTSEEVRTLIAAADRVDVDFGDYLLLAATLGGRRGELLALRRDIVDLDLGTVRIHRAMKLGDDGLVEGDTKTHQERLLPIPDGVTVRLRRMFLRHDEQALRAGIRLDGRAYLFSSRPDRTVPWRPESVGRRFRQLRASVGLDHIRGHDLRHYVGSRMVANGVDVVTVRDHLGHASITTTNIYTHGVAENARAAVEGLGVILTDAGNQN